MDKGKQKQSQTQNTTSAIDQTTNSNGSVRATAPDWISTAMQGLTGNISNLGSQNPQSFVAGANPLQSQAGAQAGQLTGRPWLLDSATGETGHVMNANAPQVGSAATASPFVNQYMDPYLSQVVGATTADLDANDARQRAQDALSLAASPGAFGGSGEALTRSLTAGEQTRARASTLGGLRSQGYSQALGAAQQDAQRSESAKELNAQLRSQQMDRALASARQLGDLSNNYDANQRANIDTQGGIGDALRQVQQQQQQAPLTLASWESGALPQLLSQFFGQDTTGTAHTIGTNNSTGTTSAEAGKSAGAGDVAAAALQIAAMFSDRRLKRDIVKLGERPDGLGVYLYRYLWSPIRFVGVMAQEVLGVKPEAVVRHPSGFLMVNYARL